MNIPSQAKTDEIYDIYGMLYQPFWNTMWFRVLSAALLIFIVAGLIFFIWKKLQQKKKILPWDFAVQCLESIQKQFLLDNDIVLNDKNKKEFYCKLIFYLKKYFISRYNIQKHGNTDKETIAILKSVRADKIVCEYVQRIFDGAVKIKFANKGVAKKQMEEDLDLAMKIIQVSLPKKDSV